ncbi:MAG: GlsB/YeaQ/YmgE family stress response membrane protein [Verrucomicrobiota bacterium]
MNIIGSIIIGLITGVIAKLLHPGKDPGGFVIAILLGLAGSLLAGWLGKLLGWYSEGEPAGFIFSVVGAIILLAGYRMLSKNKS